MPVYLFTFHAYGTWMPDRPRGYVRRGEGVLPTDVEMAEMYRRLAQEPHAIFSEAVQRAFIDEALIAGEKQRFEVRFIATETTHVHVLLSWRSEKPWEKVRSGLRQSFTRRLNRDFERREWFVDGASRKRVKDRNHFDHLVETYLPAHSGWKWSKEKGCYR
jgi:hypothetical protein